MYKTNYYLDVAKFGFALTFGCSAGIALVMSSYRAAQKVDWASLKPKSNKPVPLEPEETPVAPVLTDDPQP